MTHPVHHLSSPSMIHLMRPRPDDALKASIQELVASEKIKAGVIATYVSSLEQHNLRSANQKEAHLRKDFLEIPSLEGTVSHTSVHLCLGDQAGPTPAGPLLEKNLVHTTGEIAAAELAGLEFHRKQDPVSGYPELEILQR